MSEIKEIKAQIKYKFRGDTADNWANSNPILDIREPGLVLDQNGRTIAFKIGDGVTCWNDLELHNINTSADVDLSDYYTKTEVDEQMGNIKTAIDELRTYAVAFSTGDAT